MKRTQLLITTTTTRELGGEHSVKRIKLKMPISAHAPRMSMPPAPAKQAQLNKPLKRERLNTTVELPENEPNTLNYVWCGQINCYDGINDFSLEKTFTEWGGVEDWILFEANKLIRKKLMQQNSFAVLARELELKRSSSRFSMHGKIPTSINFFAHLVPDMPNISPKVTLAKIAIPRTGTIISVAHIAKKLHLAISQVDSWQYGAPGTTTHTLKIMNNNRVLEYDLLKFLSINFPAYFELYVLPEKRRA